MLNIIKIKIITLKINIKEIQIEIKKDKIDNLWSKII